MSVAQRIRALRRRSHLTLDALAARVGVHKGHLSRIERGQKAPSLATLEGIAMGLGASMSELFGEKAAADDVIVARAGTRITTRDAGYAVHALLPAEAGRAAALYMVEPGETFLTEDRPTHGGQEIAYVLAGEVELVVADRSVALGIGDCATYDGGLPHRLRRLGSAPASVLVIITG